MSRGVELIAKERQRQIEEEGYDAEHDKDHYEQLMRASYVYTQVAILMIANPFAAPEVLGILEAPSWWPWDAKFYKLEDPERMLVKAGALTAAALDSLADHVNRTMEAADNG